MELYTSLGDSGTFLLNSQPYLPTAILFHKQIPEKTKLIEDWGRGGGITLL
jgi:hypothetical protein